MNEVARLAIEIADEAAAMDIGAYSHHESVGSEQWLNVSTPRRWDHDRDILDRATRYLDARGKLSHHPARPELVQLGKSHGAAAR